MPKTRRRKVFIAVIAHAQGQCLCVGETRKALNREVALYIGENLDEVDDGEKRETILQRIIEGKWGDAIDLYFGWMIEHGVERLDVFDPESPKSNEGPIRIRSSHQLPEVVG